MMSPVKKYKLSLEPANTSIRESAIKLLHQAVGASVSKSQFIIYNGSREGVATKRNVLFFSYFFLTQPNFRNKSWYRYNLSQLFFSSN